MTTAARLVLQDCQHALAELRTCEPSDDQSLGTEWRYRWVAMLALLRAVGHVLTNIDAKANSKLCEANKRAYDQLRQSRPDPSIYWGFIEEERNVVLKEYAFRVGSRAIGIAVSSLHAHEPATGQLVQAGIGPYGGAQLNFFAAGPFAGRSQVHVAAEAIAWWQQYLDALDAAAGSASA